MQILGLNKTTLLDYPGCVAATVFTGGCNFCCPFCHNRELVLKPSRKNVLSEKEVLEFLKKRKNILKGICITGGEPTLQPDLLEFVARAREMGYRIKLDTNGYRPDVLQSLLKKGFLDYVAMDIKNCPGKYPLTAGIDDKTTKFDLGKITESMRMLMNGDIEYEFRTTVVEELHIIEDMVQIGEWIKGCKAYFIQKFQDHGNNIAKGYHAPGDESLKEMVQAISKIPELSGKVYLRGVG